YTTPPPPARLPFALAGCSALLRSRPLWPPPSPRSLSLTALPSCLLSTDAADDRRLFICSFFFLSGVCYREGGSHSSCPPPKRRILHPPSHPPSFLSSRARPSEPPSIRSHTTHSSLAQRSNSRLGKPLVITTALHPRNRPNFSSPSVPPVSRSSSTYTWSISKKLDCRKCKAIQPQSPSSLFVVRIFE
ncbi:hypothetical protein B0T13DRAFT_458049, partial [Neurospora crassa]